MVDPLRVGVLWDKYTPQVESSMARDLLALSDCGSLIVVTKAKDASKILKALHIEESSGKADVWCVYWTNAESTHSPEAPDSEAEVFVRDLRPLKGNDGGSLSDRLVIPMAPPNHRVRPAPPSANPLYRPMPNPYQKPLWTYGSAKTLAAKDPQPNIDAELIEALSRVLSSRR